MPGKFTRKRRSGYTPRGYSSPLSTVIFMPPYWEIAERSSNVRYNPRL